MRARLSQAPSNQTLDLSSYATRSHVPAGGSEQQRTIYTHFNLNPLRIRVPGTDVVRDVRGGQITALQTVRDTQGQDLQLVQRAMYEIVHSINQNPHDELGNFQRVQRLQQLITRQQQIGFRNVGGIRRGQLMADALTAAGMEQHLAQGAYTANLPVTTALSTPLPREVFDGSARLGAGLLPGNVLSYASIATRGRFGNSLVLNPMLAATAGTDSDGDRLRADIAGNLAQIPVYPSHRTDAGRLLVKFREQRELRLMQGDVQLARLQATTSTPYTVARAVHESVSASRKALSPQTAEHLAVMARTVIGKQGEDVGKAHLTLHAATVIDALRQLHALPEAQRTAVESSPESMAVFMALHREAFNTPGDRSMARMLERTIKATQRGKQLSVDEYETLGRMLGLNKIAQRPKGLTRQTWEQTMDYLQTHPERALVDALTRARLGLFNAQDLTEAPGFAPGPQKTRVHNLTLPRAQRGRPTQFTHLRELGLVKVRAVGDGRRGGPASHMVQFLDVDTGELQDVAGGSWVDEMGRTTRTDLVVEAGYSRTADGYKLLSGADLIEAHLEMNDPHALEIFDPVLKKDVLIGQIQGTVWDPARVEVNDALTLSNIRSLGAWSGRTPEAIRLLANHDQHSYAQLVARYQISTTHRARKALSNLPGMVQDELRGVPMRFVHDPLTGEMHIPAHVRASLGTHLQFFTGLEQGAREEDVVDAFAQVARQIRSTLGHSVAWAEAHPAGSRDIGARLLLGHGENQVPLFMDSQARVNAKRAGNSMKLSQTGELNETNILYVQLDEERYAQHLRANARMHGKRISVSEARKVMQELVGDTQHSILGAEFHLEDSLLGSQQYMERVLEKDFRAGGLRPEEAAAAGIHKFVSPQGELKSQATLAAHSMEFELETGEVMPIDMLRPIENALKRGEIDAVVEAIAHHPALSAHYRPALSAYRAVRDAETSTPEDLLVATDKFLAGGLPGTFRARDAEGRVLHQFPARALVQNTKLAHVRNTTELSPQTILELSEATDQVVLDPMDASNMLASTAHMIDAHGGQGAKAVEEALRIQTQQVPNSDMGQLLTSNLQMGRELSEALGMVNGLPRQVVESDVGHAAVVNLEQQAVNSAVQRLGFGAGHVAGEVLGTKGGLGKMLEKHALQILEQFITH